jgi:predicted nucleotidyltransferase
MNKQNIIERIVKQIRETEPDAEVILYGSYARGEQTEESDIDLLILLDKDEVSFKEEKDISFPLYDIELDSGVLISPYILSKKKWHTRHSITPFYDNVMREGVIL